MKNTRQTAEKYELNALKMYILAALQKEVYMKYTYTCILQKEKSLVSVAHLHMKYTNRDT